MQCPHNCKRYGVTIKGIIKAIFTKVWIKYLKFIINYFYTCYFIYFRGKRFHSRWISLKFNISVNYHNFSMYVN